MRIKVIFTGGTISSGLSNKIIDISASGFSQKQLIDNFYNMTGEFDIKFDISQPLNVLSENMTIENWNVLLNELRNTNFSDYDGIIIAHGTDTLGYTTNMLSIMLSGIDIPVILVSSNFVLSDEKSNGNDNFINAVYFIKEKLYSGVYVIYKNDEGKSVVYLGSRLKQCEILTNKFSSAYGIDFGEMKNNKFHPIIHHKNPTSFAIKKDKQNMLLYKINSLEPCVLLLSPYTGLDYNNITPTANIKVVLHSLYHGGTACIYSEENSSNSILSFYSRCKKNNIDFYISPLEKSNSDNYSTTAKILNVGATALYDVSIEMAYAKLLIAFSADNDELKQYIISKEL